MNTLNKASAHLLAALPAHQGVSNATFEVVHANTATASNITSAEAIKGVLAETARLVKGTLKLQSTSANNQIQRYTCKIRHQIPKIQVAIQNGNVQAPAGFVSVSKNLFMSGNSEWDVQRTSNSNCATLVRKISANQDDSLDEVLSDLFKTTASVRNGKASQELVNSLHQLYYSLSSASGILVSFADSTSNNELSLGFSLGVEADHAIVATATGPARNIPIGSINSTIDASEYQHQLRLPDMQATASVSTLDQMIRYYRQVFGMNEEFFKRWQAALRTSV